MKSNISKKEIDSGKKIINTLLVSNPRLLPFYLKNDLPKYKNFLPDINKYGLWLSKKSIKKINSNQKFDKIFLLYNGLAAGGKDSIYYEMINLYPKIFFKTISATTRPIRNDEKENIDHYFYTEEQFKLAIKNNEFLEYIKRGDSYYGLPKKSLDNAFNQPEPIIFAQLEMSSWSKIEKYLKSLKHLKTLVIKIFIIPDMNFDKYLSWLKEKRVNDDLESRINKSGWEIKKAAQRADFIITNRIRENIPTLTYTAKTIINQLIETAKLSDFKKIRTPTDNLIPTIDVENIITIHDSIM